MTRPTFTVDDAMAQAAAFIDARRARHADFRMDAGDPPAGDPPAGDPPAGDPPADETPEQVIARLTAERDEWKGHARKHETTAKARKAAADELAALKASGMTDTDKLADAEKRAADAARELVRYRVAADTGIPATLLAGDDEDAMRVHADAIKAFKGGTPPPPAPKPDPSQGNRSGPKPTAADAGRAEAERRFKK